MKSRFKWSDWQECDEGYYIRTIICGCCASTIMDLEVYYSISGSYVKWKIYLYKQDRPILRGTDCNITAAKRAATKAAKEWLE